MDQLCVTATLRSPVVTNGGYWTLDGLIAALIFEDCGDVDTAHASVPIKQTDGLFHASGALMEPYMEERIAFGASLRADHDIHPDLLKKKKDGTLNKKMDRKRRSAGGNVQNTYSTKTATEVTWYCQGDAEAIAKILTTDRVPFIGKRRASGFGEVGDWKIERSDLDSIIGPFGEPLRPVPVEMFKGDLNSVKADAAWRPAYWDLNHRAICFVPEESL